MVPRTLTTVSLLQAYIEDVKSKHPWLKRVMIFLDNATSTNKNRYLFGWAMEAVERGLLRSIHFCFLVAGYTKFSPNRLFVSSSKSCDVADVFNAEELKGIYTKHCTVAIANEKNIHPWRKYLDECYTDLPGVWKLHKFLIVQGDGGKVLFRAGERCHDPHTQMAPMRKTHTSSTDADAVSYNVRPLAKEKAIDIEQMCHRFIAQSRWPPYITPTIAAQLPTLAGRNKRKVKKKTTANKMRL